MIAARIIIIIGSLIIDVALSSELFPEVTITQGNIQGTTGTNLNGNTFYKFLGIPFAKPPVGSLRFKAPQPAEQWTGTRNCTKDASVCVQSTPEVKFFGSEDCLYLNVFTQKIPENEKSASLKPVMVAFHPGGFILGSGTQEMISADYLLTEDVVLVSLNYRLGVFGFLSLENDNLDVPGNAGLKDQLLALKWVKENIAKFNGDPDNITIFGISAGGASVQFMMLSSSANGLFHKAIIESGSVLNPWAWGQKNAIQLAKKLDENISNESDALNFLIKASSKEVFESSLKFPGTLTVDESHQRRPFGPIIENPNPTAFITEDPLELLENGVVNDVPLMIGVCSNEGLIEEIGTTLGVEGCSDPLQCSVPWMMNVRSKPQKLEQIKNTISKFYFKNISSKSSVQDLFSDVIITEGVFSSAKMHFKKTKNQMYFYVLDYEPPMIQTFKKFLNLDNNTLGLPHASDSFFLFNSQIVGNVVLVDEDIKAIRKIVKMWTDFVKTGHPDSQWKPVNNAETINYLLIQEKSEMKINPFKERMNFWKGLKENYPLNFRSFEKA